MTPTVTLPVVAEDADAHRDAARHRRPDRHGADRGAGQVDGLTRPRHVRDDGGALRREEVDHRRLDLRQASCPSARASPYAIAPSGERLDVVHAPLDLAQTGARRPGARPAVTGRRGRSGCPGSRGSGWSSGRRLNGTIAWISSTSVARPRRYRRSAPVIAATSTSLTVASLAWAMSLDRVERERLRPRDAARDARVALERRLGVGRRSQDIRERLRVARAGRPPDARISADGCASVSRPSCAAPRPRAAPAAAPRRRAGHDATAAAPGRRRRGGRRRRCRRPALASVSDSSTRASAIPSAMQWCMRATSAQPVAVAVDEVEAPTAAARGRAASPSGRRRAPPARRGRPGAGSATWCRCRSRSKCGSSSQCGAAEQPPLTHALAEARERLDEPLAQRPRAAAPSRPARRRQDPVDDHEVGRAVHAQPGRVRASASFASGRRWIVAPCEPPRDVRPGGGAPRSSPARTRGRPTAR